MFTGEAMCLLLFLYRRRQAAARERARQEEGEYNVPLSNNAQSLTSPAYNFLSPTMARVQKEGLVDENSTVEEIIESDKMYNNVKCSSALYCVVPAICDLGTIFSFLYCYLYCSTTFIELY